MTTTLPSAELVVIVDDDPFVLAATSSLVRSLGWEASTFGSAAAFLGSEAPARASCLVCDVQMDGMDGIELLAHLRAGGWRVPTLIITAGVTDRVVEQASAHGALCVIEKPIDAEEIERWITYALTSP